MAASRIFELRTYHAEPGKLDDLQARFRDHTMGLFDRHGISVVGFWMPVDDKDRADATLVYLLAFDDRDAARQAWSAFRDDPDWVEAKANSEKQGPLVAAIDSVFLSPTDYSPLT
jgi:hypothetical protein